MKTPRFPALLVLTLAAASSGGAAALDAPPPANPGTIVVTLDDGTTVPLQNWTLSYEYGMAKAGVSPLFAPTARKAASELYVGKKALPGAGQTLGIVYAESMRST